MPRAFSEMPLPLFSGDPDEAISASALARGTKAKLPSYIGDHRKRLRERFMSGGADALPDYELLELVLFRAIPRQDVKPLARRLIDHFGDFNRVLSAPVDRLRAVDGVGPAVVTELKVVEAAAHRLARAHAHHPDRARSVAGDFVVTRLALAAAGALAVVAAVPWIQRLAPVIDLTAVLLAVA